MAGKYSYNRTWKTIVIRFSILSCLLVLQIVALAQVKFYTRIDPAVTGRNQPVQVQYVIENAKSIDEFKAPAFDDFILIQGPIESSGMSIINGSTTQYKSLLFLLQPKTIGKLNIKGATALVDGKQMKSNSAVVQVINKNVTTPQSSNPGFNFNFPEERPDVDREFYLRPGENVIEKIKQNLFVKVEVNKTNCFVNEPIVATYKLYSRLRSESRVVKRPSYNGFSVYDMVEPDGSVTSTEVVNGKEYNVHLIRQSQLFPLQAGTYTLDPVEVENTVRFIKSEGDQGNPFDELFGTGGPMIEQTLSLSSKPVTITVKPLPVEKQPVSFDGAVGNFSISASLSKDTIHAGEMANLTVKIKGKGNLPMINAPDIKWPKGMEGFDAQANEEIHPETIPLSGVKTYRFPVTAKKEGPSQVPALQFSFFDPSTQSYKTDSTTTIPLYVLAALPGQKAIVNPVARSGKAINPVPRNFLLLLAAVVVLVFAIIWMVLYSKSKKRKQEQEKLLKAQQEQAQKIKTDPLTKARLLLGMGDQTAFLKEIENAIWKKSAETLSIPSTMLNQPRVIRELKARGANDAADLFREVANNCEASLYIPGTPFENLQDILSKAEELIGKLDLLAENKS